MVLSNAWMTNSCLRDFLNWTHWRISLLTKFLVLIPRCDIGFMKPRHRNKPNITYSLVLLYLLCFTPFSRAEGTPVVSTVNLFDCLSIDPLVLPHPLTSQYFVNTIHIWGMVWPGNESEDRAKFHVPITDYMPSQYKDCLSGCRDSYLLRWDGRQTVCFFITGILYW